MLYGSIDYDPAVHRLVLVHIRKTGGTSLGHMLARAFGNPLTELTREGEFARHDRGILRLHRRLRHGILAARRRAEIARRQRRGRPAYRAAEAPFVGGHFALGHEPPSPRAPLYLTLVRDPVDRLLSDYWFMRGKRDRSLGDVADPRLYDRPLADFAGAILADPGLYRDNLQCRMLAGGPSGEAAAATIDARVFLAARTDQLGEMAALLGRAIGRDLGPVPRAKSNARRPADPGLPRATLEGLRALNAGDAALVAHVGDAFEAMAARAGDG